MFSGGIENQHRAVMGQTGIYLQDSVCIFNFEQISHIVLVFLSLTLSVVSYLYQLLVSLLVFTCSESAIVMLQ